MYPIKDVSTLDISFPGAVSHLMPEYDKIPLEFREGRHPMSAVSTQWFYAGLPRGTKFVPRDGVDGDSAVRHASAILHSIESNHAHKIAGVAFLLNEWFLNVIIPDSDLTSKK